MTLTEFRAQLEADRAWREEELAAFHNQGARLSDEGERNRFRRALVLLLYAHFEGYCKFAFALYASAINNAGLHCAEVTSPIAALSMDRLFGDLMNAERRPTSSYFRGRLPEDAKLHRFARIREFIERSAEFGQLPVQIEDNAIDMESNLTPVVLQKNLFRLGLPPDLANEEESGKLQKLLRFRNDIAHGTGKAGIAQDVYEALRRTTASVMTNLTIAITDALRAKNYLRPYPTTARHETRT